MPYYSSLDRIICIYFGVFAILTLIFCLSWGTKLSKHNQNGVVWESNLWRGRDKNLFFLYKNVGLLLILFITFKAIDSQERVSCNKQPRYVAVWYCLLCISPYVISRLLILLSICFVPNSIRFVLSSPKWLLSLLSTNQSQTFEKFLYRFLSIYFKSLCW